MLRVVYVIYHKHEARLVFVISKYTTLNMGLYVSASCL
jgi:hypothetical protein